MNWNIMFYLLKNDGLNLTNWMCFLMQCFKSSSESQWNKCTLMKYSLTSLDDSKSASPFPWPHQTWAEAWDPRLPCFPPPPGLLASCLQPGQWHNFIIAVMKCLQLIKYKQKIEHLQLAISSFLATFHKISAIAPIRISFCPASSGLRRFSLKNQSC